LLSPLIGEYSLATAAGKLGDDPFPGGDILERFLAEKEFGGDIRSQHKL